MSAVVEQLARRDIAAAIGQLNREGGFAADWQSRTAAETGGARAALRTGVLSTRDGPLNAAGRIRDWRASLAEASGADDRAVR